MTEAHDGVGINAMQLFNDILDVVFPAPASAKRQADPPHVKDGRLFAPYVDEVSLRHNLAEVARAYGWVVTEELVVPGWGRIDIVLQEPRSPESILLELKLELTKPAKVRRAFQQADGYGRWWAANRGTPSQTYLIGVDAADELIGSVQAVYPTVGYTRADQLLTLLSKWGNPSGRVALARRRLNEIRRSLAVHEYAVDVLDPPFASRGASCIDQSP